jgi:hypothetical protein
MNPTQNPAIPGPTSGLEPHDTPRRNTVNPGLTPNPRTRNAAEPGRRVVENDQYAAFARRIVRAYAVRIAAGDVEALPGLLALSEEINTHVHAAVNGLRAFGYSWTDIAARIGVTRQAAQQRWGGGKP